MPESRADGGIGAYRPMPVAGASANRPHLEIRSERPKRLDAELARWRAALSSQPAESPTNGHDYPGYS
jgi:hypothetical protein